MSRFDPIEGKDYAECMDCPEKMATREDMSAHFKASSRGGKSHRARITNPTREERIEHELSDLADSVMHDLIYEIERLVDDGEASEEEVAEAARYVVMDLSDVWKKALS